MTKQRLLLAVAPLALALAGCSGGLGDGVRLESIDIRTASGTLDASGNATGDNLTIGRCVTLPLSFLTTFSDGEQRAFADRAKWTSSNPDVIAIINSRATDDNLNRQFPLAIAASTSPVTLTANFAGVTDTVNVTVLDSELVIEPSTRTFALGIETPLSAQLLVGGLQSIQRSGTSVNWSNNGSTTVEIGSPDSEENDLREGVMSATTAGSATITAELNQSIALVNLSEFFLNDGSLLGDVCNLTATAQVSAEEPASFEVVPAFVSPNSTDQSAVNSLFLASGTSANVSVEAVFTDGQRQTITPVVTWLYNAADQATADNNADDDSTNDTPLLLLPDRGQGLISAGLEDHDLPGNPELIASVQRGVVDTSEDRPADDLDDDTVTLTVMIDEYQDSEIELVLKPDTNSKVAFGSAVTYRVLGLFGNPNRAEESADLVLDLTANNLRYAGSTTPADDDDITDIFSAPLETGFVGLVNVFVKPDADEETPDVPADSQTLQFDLTGALLADGTELTVRALSNETTLTLADADLNMLDSDDALAITLEGETTAAADGLCVEIGQALDLDARVLFADESGDTVLSSIVTEDSVWTITSGEQAITVRNDFGLRGRVNVVSISPTSATLQALYINNKVDGGTDSKIQIMDTLNLTVMDVDGCP